MSKLVNPRGGKTTNWRAGCGRSARPVRREGESQALPTPIKLTPVSSADHGFEAVAIRIPSAGDARVSGRGEAFAQRGVAEQLMRFLDHLWMVAEVQYAFAFWAEDLAMLRRIFREQTRAHRWRFAGAHRMAV